MIIAHFGKNRRDYLTAFRRFGDPLCPSPANANPALALPRPFRIPCPRVQASLTRCQETRNPAGFPAGFAFDRGAGGIRTLVQTSNDHAFYMLSFCLVVGTQLTKNRPLRA